MGDKKLQAKKMSLKNKAIFIALSMRDTVTRRFPFRTKTK